MKLFWIVGPSLEYGSVTLFGSPIDVTVNTFRFGSFEIVGVNAFMLSFPNVYGLKVPAKTCQAKIDLATKLKIM